MTPTFRAVTQGSINTVTSLSPKSPASTQVGDLLLVSCITTAETAPSFTAGTSLGSGEPVVGGLYGAAWWMIATAAGAQTLGSITWGGGSEVANYLVLAVQAGTFNASVPVAVSAHQNNASATSMPFPAVTNPTAGAGGLDVLLGVLQNAPAASALTGYTIEQNNTAAMFAAISNAGLASGAAGAVTFTLADVSPSFALRAVIAPPAASPSGATAKVWNGSAWAAHPVKRWNGSAWTQAASIKPGSGTPPVSSGAVYFAAADPFNAKISANPSIDSNSATWISMLAGTAEKGLSITNAYGYPIFHASASDPVVTIHATTYDTATAYTFHLPANAAPNTGSDGHMVIVEPDGETTTDFYQATVSGGTITAAGISQYKSSKTDGSSILTVGHLYGSRAAGLALLGGAILGADYTSGVIPHALSFACTVNANSFRAPAVHTDGTVSGGLPQGARIQLDPAYDITQLNVDLRPIAKAMQDYGAIDVDSGSGGIQLFGESTATAGNVYPSLWSQSANLDAFPWSSCRVLANSVNP